MLFVVDMDTFGGKPCQVLRIRDDDRPPMSMPGGFIYFVRMGVEHRARSPGFSHEGTQCGFPGSIPTN